MKCFAGKWKYLPQKINSEIHEAGMEPMTVIKVTFFPADSNTIAACCNSNKLHIIRILWVSNPFYTNKHVYPWRRKKITWTSSQCWLEAGYQEKGYIAKGVIYQKRHKVKRFPKQDPALEIEIFYCWSVLLFTLAEWFWRFLQSPLPLSWLHNDTDRWLIHSVHGVLSGRELNKVVYWIQ